VRFPPLLTQIEYWTPSDNDRLDDRYLFISFYTTVHEGWQTPHECDEIVVATLHVVKSTSHPTLLRSMARVPLKGQ